MNAEAARVLAADLVRHADGADEEWAAIVQSYEAARAATDAD
jgi:hypothetical protein